MKSLSDNFSALVIGASGGIGSAIVAALGEDPSVRRIYAASRQPVAPASAKLQALPLDVTDAASIAAAAAVCAADDALELIVVATGVLHSGRALQPEKTWDSLDPESIARTFAVNATGPALVARYFLPLLPQRRSVFAALSARVGSIGDNRLGGWYAYRASKAALNMLIKTLAIELNRKNPSALCIGLHPGTVDTSLSAPFQSRTPTERLFSKERAARQLLGVIDAAHISQSGKLLAWNGEEITP